MAARRDPAAGGFAGQGAEAPAALLRLLTWTSPAFPVGAFSYSHGLEWAIEAGAVRDAESLGAWLDDLLRHGSARSDAVLFVHVWRAVRAGDWAGAAGLAELSAALQPSRERALEATAQGAAFALGIGAAWPCEAYDEVGAPELTYPVALAIAAAAHGLPLRASLAGMLHAFASNLVSAGVKLIPLGQSAGLRLLAGLEPVLLELLDEAERASLDEIGGCAILSDVASMRHETQYTRLFRT